MTVVASQPITPPFADDRYLATEAQDVKALAIFCADGTVVEPQERHVKKIADYYQLGRYTKFSETGGPHDLMREHSVAFAKLDVILGIFSEIRSLIFMPHTPCGLYKKEHGDRHQECLHDDLLKAETLFFDRYPQLQQVIICCCHKANNTETNETEVYFQHPTIHARP